jgi:hypothetical protein
MGCIGKIISFLRVILGLALVGCGLFALFYYGQYTTITCKKVAGAYVDCTKRILWLNKWQVLQDEVLPHVIKGRVENSCMTSRILYRKYRCFSDVLVIENKEKSFKISSPFFNETTVAETNDRINAYIHQPGGAPLIINCGNTLYTILGFGFVVVPFMGLGGMLLKAILPDRRIKSLQRKRNNTRVFPKKSS